jgi:hypothetical protein
VERGPGGEVKNRTGLIGTFSCRIGGQMPANRNNIREAVREILSGGESGQLALFEVSDLPLRRAVFEEPSEAVDRERASEVRSLFEKVPNESA